MPRQQVNTRLPAITVRQIADLVESGYESQSAAIATAVDRLWVQERNMTINEYERTLASALSKSGPDRIAALEDLQNAVLVETGDELTDAEVDRADALIEEETAKHSYYS